MPPANTQAKNGLDPRPLHPASGPRVPSPTAAPHMARVCVDIRRNDIGLDLVPQHAGATARTVDRVDDAEQPCSLVALTERSKSHHHPQRSMGILTAVLAKPWRVALDVAGIQGRLVERRIDW